MKITRTTTLHEIRKMGYSALARELGPYGLLRFLQQYEAGSGDYTRDRHLWLGDPTLNEIVEQIREIRQKRELGSGRSARRRKAG